ncbi:MAG: hypothetical protein ACLP8A_14165 [Methylovirgula sp.]
MTRTMIHTTRLRNADGRNAQAPLASFFQALGQFFALSPQAHDDAIAERFAGCARCDSVERDLNDAVTGDRRDRGL